MVLSFKYLSNIQFISVNISNAFREYFLLVILIIFYASIVFQFNNDITIHVAYITDDDIDHNFIDIYKPSNLVIKKEMMI